MKNDQRRVTLGLPQYGEVSEDAIRAAYWRIVRQLYLSRENKFDFEQVRKAKHELLMEAGVRIPKPKGSKI